MIILDDLDNNKSTVPSEPIRLDPAPRTRKADASKYFPDPGLTDAIRVALVLRKPLLLTGPPGTGKTELGFYLHWKLGYAGEPLLFDAKSTSTARDLFYSYNTVGRFHAVYTRRRDVKDVDFITYNALGEAILQGNKYEAVQDILPNDFKHKGPRPSVVIIDEVDKAPRDFPNDILNELEKSYFRIAELGNRRIDTLEGNEPILVIPSNSEKSLPAPFLRRCVYYNIPLPVNTRLQQILKAKLSIAENKSNLVSDAVEFFLKLQEDGSGLQRAPATAELIDWVAFLIAMKLRPDQLLRDAKPLVKSSIGTLVKHMDDQPRASELLNTWLGN